MKKYFLITRENEQLISFVYPAIKKDFEKKSNKKVEFLKYKPKYKLNFFVIFQLLKLFSRKLL